MHIVLDLAADDAGTRRGTARRSDDPESSAVEFHGVLELIAVLDRLLLARPPTR